MTELPADLARFVRGETDPATFTHREHVRMAFELLRRCDFPRPRCITHARCRP